MIIRMSRLKPALWQLTARPMSKSASMRSTGSVAIGEITVRAVEGDGSRGLIADRRAISAMTVPGTSASATGQVSPVAPAPPGLPEDAQSGS